MPHKEPLIFNTVKCKLSSVVKSEKALLELAHEVHKRTSSFFRLYCLSRDELPEVSESTLKLCANQISVRSASGAKAKDDGNLSEKFQSFLEGSLQRRVSRKAGRQGEMQNGS